MATRSIPAPRLNRIVQLQRRTVSRDNFGSEVETWSSVAEVWASVIQTGTAENFENDANRAIAKRSAQITIRWLPNIKETWRVIHVGLIWDIKGIAEIGRRAGLTLLCETDVNRKAEQGVSAQRSLQTEPPKTPLPPDPKEEPEKPVR